MNLAYNYQSAYDAGITGHAQTQMKKLGISWDNSVGQSLYDSFWFFGCRNVPDPLPSYLRILPHDLPT